MKITQEQMITATTTSSSNFSEADHNPMKFTLKFRNRQQYRDSEINSSSIILNKNNDKDNNNIRVCSDCNTTTTPLWRSGPRGPKSLCNACGIRQRKARRAMAVVGTNGTLTSTEATSSSTKINNSKVINNFKEKKCRTSHKKICFKKLALHYLGKNAGIERVFPKDVEEAAILLMELSCGFFHT